MAAFGLLSALVQLISALWAMKEGFPYPAWLMTTIGLASFGYGAFRARPKYRLSHSFSHPDLTIEVVVGDIFEQDAHLVVGASDTFDTDITDDLIINSKSVLGQCLLKAFEGDRRRLDGELRSALRRVAPVAEEASNAKRGKLKRYEMGTVAVLGIPARRIFLVAYSRMGNDLIARSTVNDLWQALGQVWSVMRDHGRRESIAIPLIGTEFARVSSMNKENVAKMILLSFMAHSRAEPICKRLLLMVEPRDAEAVNMYELEAYLKSL
ncbi:macro domain-containing protein [Spirillospora sp. NPDC127200]